MAAVTPPSSSSSSSSSLDWCVLLRVTPPPLVFLGGPRGRRCALLMLALLLVLSWRTAAWLLLTQQDHHHQPHRRMVARHLDSDHYWPPSELGRRISSKDAWLLEQDWPDDPHYRRAMMSGTMAHVNAGDGGGQPGSKPPPCHNQCPGCSPLYGQCVAKPTYVPGSHGVGHAVWTCTCV